MSEPADSSLHQGRYCVGDDSVPLAVLRIRCSYYRLFYTFIVLSDKYDLSPPGGCRWAVQ